MLVVHSEQHKYHDPAEFLSAGQMKPSPECPERMVRLWQGIDQGKLVPLLVAAIQELSAQVDELRAA